MNPTLLADKPKSISRRREILICLSLVLSTLAVYWPVRDFDFVNIDDWAYVTENPNVQRGLSWENFKWRFKPTSLRIGIRSRLFLTCSIANCLA